jgi:Pyruvate/2-oxoacid:ferredoxin oxidoreductase delta subunit
MPQKIFLKRYKKMIEPEIKKIFAIPELRRAEKFLDVILPPELLAGIKTCAAHWGNGAFSGCDAVAAGIDANMLYRRGFLDYVSGSKKPGAGQAYCAAFFKIANFYTRLDVFVLSEYGTYCTISEEARQELDAWYFDAYYSRLDIDAGSAPTEDAVFTLSETLQFIEHETRVPYLTHCDCRALAALSNKCAKPLRTCITFRNEPNTSVHRGLAQCITKEYAKQAVVNADKSGLMHRVNSGTICNCCADCCYLSRAAARRAAELNVSTYIRWPLQNKRVQFDNGKCVQCEVCVERCPYKLFSHTEDGISVDSARCAGCGLCVNTCAAGALLLCSV